MNWQDLWAALALVLVIEGLLPFFNPRGYKSMMQQMATFPEQTLRSIGFVMMLVGVVAIYLVRG